MSNDPSRPAVSSVLFPLARACAIGLCLVGVGCKERGADRARTDGKQAAPGSKPTGIKLPSVFARPAFAYAAKSAGGKEVSLADIAERAVRSVVNVRTMKAMPSPGTPFPGLPFGHPPTGRQPRGLGSGVIVGASGIVVTNHHVVDKASEIRLTIAGDRDFEATVVGSDEKSDLAVLRIKNPPKDLVPIAIGDSDGLRLGEVVLAIGNPFGVGQTVTMGIVSAKGRANMGIIDYEDFIQTDAAINPGNSGGALVNMRGELIGINTAILSRTGGSQGIGFAIPSKMANAIMKNLLEHGHVVRGWLGVMIQDLDKEMAGALGVNVKHGVVVSGVQPGSPAERAGLQRGDVIVAIDGRQTTTVAKVRNEVAIRGAKVKVNVTLHRGQARKEIPVLLGELPSDRVASIGQSQGALGGLTVGNLDDAARQRAGLPPRSEGVVVTEVKPGSAAEAAGLRADDVIVELNRKPVEDTAAFASAYRAARSKLLLLVFRRGTALYILLDK